LEAGAFCNKRPLLPSLSPQQGLLVLRPPHSRGVVMKISILDKKSKIDDFSHLRTMHIVIFIVFAEKCSISVRHAA